MIKLTSLLIERKVLRVYDFDDTLAHTDASVKVIHSTGKQTNLLPRQYAKYEPQSGDKFDFSDFNRTLINPKLIKQNIDLLMRMLDKPHKKVVILTARGIGFPVKKYLKDTLGIDVEVVALGSADPQEKKKWIEKQIKVGYEDISYMDDSKKNIDAVESLRHDYPNITLKTKLV